MASVTVRGTGHVRTSPDEASVTLTLDAVEPTAAAALAKVAERTRAALELCAAHGIEPASRVTTGASVAEHGEHDREGRWQHPGYRASNHVGVRVGDAGVVGELVAGGADLGASVHGPAWSVAPTNPAYAEACAAAARDARRRAEAYADALGARIGAIVAVRDPGTGPPPFPPGPRVGAVARMDTGAEALPVEAGEQLLAVVVEVEFQLEQGQA
jgi:uncharacterized protein YggE